MLCHENRLHIGKIELMHLTGDLAMLDHEWQDLIEVRSVVDGRLNACVLCRCARGKRERGVMCTCARVYVCVSVCLYAVYVCGHVPVRCLPCLFF